MRPTGSEGAQACSAPREPIERMRLVVDLLLHEATKPHGARMHQRVQEFYETVTFKRDQLVFEDKVIECRWQQRVNFNHMLLQLMEAYELPRYTAELLLRNVLVHRAPQLLVLQNLDHSLELDQASYDSLVLLTDLFFHTSARATSEKKRWIEGFGKAASNEKALWRLVHEMSLRLNANPLDASELLRLRHPKLSAEQTQRVVAAIKKYADNQGYYDFPDVENLFRFIQSDRALLCDGSEKRSKVQACQKKVLLFIGAHNALAECYQAPSRLQQLLKKFVVLKSRKIHLFGLELPFRTAVEELEEKFGLDKPAATAFLDQVYSSYAPQLLLLKGSGDKDYFQVAPGAYAAELAILGEWFQGLDTKTIHEEILPAFQRKLHAEEPTGSRDAPVRALLQEPVERSVRSGHLHEASLNSSEYAKQSNELLEFDGIQNKSRLVQLLRKDCHRHYDQRPESSELCEEISEFFLRTPPEQLEKLFSAPITIVSEQEQSLVRHIAVRLIAAMDPFPYLLSAVQHQALRQAIHTSTSFDVNQIVFMNKGYSFENLRAELQAEFPALSEANLAAFEDNLLLAVMPQALFQKTAHLKDSVQLSLLGSYLQQQSSELLSVEKVKALADEREGNLVTLVNEALIQVYRDNQLHAVDAFDSALERLRARVYQSRALLNQYHLMNPVQKGDYNRGLQAFLAQWLERYRAFELISTLSNGATRYGELLNGALEKALGKKADRLYARIYLPDPEQLILDTKQVAADPAQVVLKYTGTEGPLAGRCLLAPKGALAQLKRQKPVCKAEQQTREYDQQRPREKLSKLLPDAIKLLVSSNPVPPQLMESVHQAFLKEALLCDQFVIVEPVKLQVEVGAPARGTAAGSGRGTRACEARTYDDRIRSRMEWDPTTCDAAVSSLYGESACHTEGSQGIDPPDLDAPVVTFTPLHNATSQPELALVKLNKVKLLNSYVQLTENPLWAKHSVLPLATLFMTDIVDRDAQPLLLNRFLAEGTSVVGDHYEQIEADLATKERFFQSQFPKHLGAIMAGWKQSNNPAFQRLEALFNDRAADAKIFTLHVKKLPELEGAEEALVVGTEHFYSSPEHFYISYLVPSASQTASGQLRRYLLFTIQPESLQLSVHDLGASELAELNLALEGKHQEHWKQCEDNLIRQLPDDEQRMQLQAAPRTEKLVFESERPLIMNDCMPDKYILENHRCASSITWTIANGKHPVVHYITSHPEHLMGGRDGHPTEDTSLPTAIKKSVTIRPFYCKRGYPHEGIPEQRECYPFVTLSPSIQVMQLNERPFVEQKPSWDRSPLAGISALVAEQLQLLIKASEGARQPRKGDALRQFTEKATTAYEKSHAWHEWARAGIGLFIPPVQTCGGQEYDRKQCIVDSMSFALDVAVSLVTSVITAPAKATLKLMLRELAGAATGGLTDLPMGIPSLVKQINRSLKKASQNAISAHEVEEILTLLRTVEGPGNRNLVETLSSFQDIETYQRYLKQVLVNDPKALKRLDALIEKLNVLQSSPVDPDALKRLVKNASEEKAKHAVGMQRAILPSREATVLTRTERQWLADNLPATATMKKSFKVWEREARSQPEQVLDALYEELLSTLPLLKDCSISRRQKRGLKSRLLCRFDRTTKMLAYLRIKKMRSVDQKILDAQYVAGAMEKYDEAWRASFKLFGRDMQYNPRYRERMETYFFDKANPIFSKAEHLELSRLKRALEDANVELRTIPQGTFFLHRYSWQEMQAAKDSLLTYFSELERAATQVAAIPAEKLFRQQQALHAVQGARDDLLAYFSVMEEAAKKFEAISVEKLLHQPLALPETQAATDKLGASFSALQKDIFDGADPVFPELQPLEFWTRKRRLEQAGKGLEAIPTGHARRLEQAELLKKDTEQAFSAYFSGLGEDKQIAVFKRYWTDMFHESQTSIDTLLANFDAHVFTAADSLPGGGKGAIAIVYADRYQAAAKDPSGNGGGSTQFFGINRKAMRKLAQRNDGVTGALFDKTFRHETLHAASVQSLYGEPSFTVIDHAYVSKGNAQLDLQQMLKTQIEPVSAGPQLMLDNQQAALNPRGRLAENADTGAFIFSMLKWMDAPEHSPLKKAYRRTLKFSEEVPTGDPKLLEQYLLEHLEDGALRIL